ncbi:hypothetical protein ACTFIW_004109 [Dictyostelium discoideum]
MIDYKINEILVKQLNDDYNCSICVDPVLNSLPLEQHQALSCKNGHLLCQTCWGKQLALRKECCICKIKVESISELCRNIFLEKGFRNKKVHCPNGFENFKVDEKLIKDESDGCKSVITIDQLESHLRECEFVFIECPNDPIRCKDKFRKNQTDKHMNKCQYVTINCEHCKEPVIKNDMPTHIENDCSIISLECEFCKDKFGRRSLESHIANECPNVVIDCPHKEGGCTARIKRCDLSQHLTEEDNHIRYMQKIIEKHRIQVEESDRIIKKLRVDYKELEKRVEITSRYKGNWTIENWSQKLTHYPNNERLKSPYFCIGSKSFYVGLYPNGFNQTNAGFMSIFLHLYEKPSTSTTVVRFSFELLHSDPTKSLKFEKSNKYTENKGSGFSQFIDVKMINNFIIDGKLTINIDVEVIPPSSSLVTK